MMMDHLYTNRKLAEGYPDLEKLGVDYYAEAQEAQSRSPEVIMCLERLIDFNEGPKTIVEVGCGPNPRSVKTLLEMGYDAKGVEPIAGYVRSGREFLGDPQRIQQGSAEMIPFEDNSQRVVLLQSVLEHVDSPLKTLQEIYRVLMPGGLAYIYTTNRYRFSPTGNNGEFRTRFYNWFPAIVKESYVFQHLHYDPRLANYTPRPAVHWFSYTDLCKLGRQVGFAQFYSLLDLMETSDPSVSGSRLRRLLLNRLKRSPWLRSLALTQVGNSIVMLKRFA